MAPDSETNNESTPEKRSLLAVWTDSVLRHTVAVLVVIFGLAVGLVIWNQSRLTLRLVDSNTLAEAKRYSLALSTFRTLYTRDVVETVRAQNIEVTHDFDSEEKRGKAIPLPATLSMMLGSELAKDQSGGFTRLYSDFPFNYANRTGLSDQFAKDAWAALNKDRHEPFYRSEVVNGKRSLRYATADIMRESCVNCHNSHPDTPKDDWKIDDVRGVLEVTIPLDLAEESVDDSLQESLLLLGFLAVIGVASLAVVIGRLRRTTVELEERVVERTQELEFANEKAQLANRAKSQFLANMSHEIRTPLNAVIGLTEIVLGSELNEVQNDHLSTVVDSAESLLSVINDILDFSKIEAGKLDMEQVHFNLHDVVGDTLKSLALRAEYKNIELACFIDPSLPHVFIGDPARLRQVITNLVNNAIKFTHEGEVIVRVEPDGNAEGDASGNQRLYFSVQDTGIGIEPELLDRLFIAFEQADSSTTRRYGGTGLGLSISSVLVELMGGQLGVESTVNEGSIFHFTAAFGVGVDERDQQERLMIPLEGLRVLIVDDNATNRKILHDVTLAKHMQPVLATSVDEAFGLLQQAEDAGNPIRLVLSDVNMPDQDGFDFASLIRSDRRFDDVEIIFLTSAGREGDLQRCEELRIAARLMKPVKQSELFEVVVRTLGIDPLDGQFHFEETKRTVHLPPLRILLVEDSIANQKVALAILNEHSHTVVIANNGRQALDLLAGQEFDVVLMDVQMPEMDGHTATANIRALEKNTDRHQPIIAMTAHALAGDREKCLAVGMDDYVSKPVRREDLFLALARVTGHSLDSTGNIPASFPTQKKSDPPTTVVTPAGTSTAGFDLSKLAKLLNDDHELVISIVQDYVVEIRENMELLPELISSGEINEVRRRAHMIVGATRQLGADATCELAGTLEDQARSEDLTGADGLLNELTAELEMMLVNLDKFVHNA
jgi:two-component system, sensor histidine kinase and response regulator